MCLDTPTFVYNPHHWSLLPSMSMLLVFSMNLPLLVGKIIYSFEARYSLQDHRLPLFLMEYCSRSIVMAVQVMAGMWKRNGYSVVNQIINYQYHISREIMYDKDVLMLQVCMHIHDPCIVHPNSLSIRT